MTDDQYQALISDRFFKPQQLTLNSDKFQNDSSDKAVISKNMRDLIFKTAQVYRDDMIKVEKEQTESISKVALFDGAQQNNLLKLLIKIYTLGLQNGAVSYANSLISAIELTDEVMNE